MKIRIRRTLTVLIICSLLVQLETLKAQNCDKYYVTEEVEGTIGFNEFSFCTDGRGQGWFYFGSADVLNYASVNRFQNMGRNEMRYVFEDVYENLGLIQVNFRDKYAYYEKGYINGQFLFADQAEYRAILQRKDVQRYASISESMKSGDVRGAYRLMMDLSYPDKYFEYQSVVRKYSTELADQALSNAAKENYSEAFDLASRIPDEEIRNTTVEGVSKRGMTSINKYLENENYEDAIQLKNLMEGSQLGNEAQDKIQSVIGALASAKRIDIASSKSFIDLNSTRLLKMREGVYSFTLNQRGEVQYIERDNSVVDESVIDWFPLETAEIPEVNIGGQNFKTSSRLTLKIEKSSVLDHYEFYVSDRFSGDLMRTSSGKFFKRGVFKWRTGEKVKYDQSTSVKKNRVKLTTVYKEDVKVNNLLVGSNYLKEDSEERIKSLLHQQVITALGVVYLVLIIVTVS